MKLLTYIAQVVIGISRILFVVFRLLCNYLDFAYIHSFIFIAAES